MRFGKKIEEFGVWVHSHRKKAVIAAIAVAAVLLFAFGTKAYLFVNFLLGNDVIVRLDSDAEFVSLVHGESAQVVFTSSVTTNPFCTASCFSVFEDVSGSSVIDNSSFTLKPGFPIEKSFTVEPFDYGTGQRLYRFSMECSSRSTALCHTDGEPTQRSALVTVGYGLNEGEKALKGQLGSQLPVLRERAAAAIAMQHHLSAAVSSSRESFDVSAFEQNLSETLGIVSGLENGLLNLESLWESGRYEQLDASAFSFESALSPVEKRLSAINRSVKESVARYNSLLGNLSAERQVISSLQGSLILDRELARGINSSVVEFNSAVRAFESSLPLSFRERSVMRAAANARNLSSQVESHARNSAIEKSVNAAISYGLLCFAADACVSHASVSDISQRVGFDLASSCREVDGLLSFYSGLNASMNSSFAAQNYPSDAEFWLNVSEIAAGMRSDISAAYLQELSNTSPGYDSIVPLLTLTNVTSNANYSEFNLTPALVASLHGFFPAACAPADVNTSALSSITALEISVPQLEKVNLSAAFDDPSPQCCVFGSCRQCCASPECLSSPEDYPVVFLHGHAFNRDVSAEYSLDAFNQVQAQLEQDGYLDSGSITLYTEQDVPEGVWGRPGVPVTIKASYYFDLFREPENYVVVQTKSESIDTYAVRLKELLDRVQYRTGRPKVRIIASSMGGLVARRYVQIFGTSGVESIILVGTPNHGIEGNVADFCPLIGERLECRDMKEGSLFLNKLNRDPLPGIPVHNIVGTGCRMGGELGDGVVLERNAVLEGAANYFINGSCSRFEPLHTTMLELDVHPETYGIIKSALED